MDPIEFFPETPLLPFLLPATSHCGNMPAPCGARSMATLLEYVGNVHIYLGPYRGNPIALYLKRNGDRCVISPKVYPWNEVVGVGETPNKAAADFEDKWKSKGLTPEMYTGPSWEGGIKPERPKPAPPPKPAAAAAPAGATKPSGDAAQTAASAPPQKPAETTPAAAAQPAASAAPSSPSPQDGPSDSHAATGAPPATNVNSQAPAHAAVRPGADGSTEPSPQPESSDSTNSSDENSPTPRQN